jgi:hypothetical protein
MDLVHKSHEKINQQFFFLSSTLKSEVGIFSFCLLMRNTKEETLSKEEVSRKEDDTQEISIAIV